MKKKRKYLVPTTMVHKIMGSVVMIGNSGEGLNSEVSNAPDTHSNDPNDSRRGYWDDWDDEYDE